MFMCVSELIRCYVLALLFMMMMIVLIMLSRHTQILCLFYDQIPLKGNTVKINDAALINFTYARTHNTLDNSNSHVCVNMRCVCVCVLSVLCVLYVVCVFVCVPACIYFKVTFPIEQGIRVCR